MNDYITDMNVDRNDTRPLPLIVAAKWGFDLDHAETDAEAIYCARDWYIGLGGSKNGWTQFKKVWVSVTNPVMVEVRRKNRPAEQMEYVTAEGLYQIAGRMTPANNRPQLKEIQSYLNKSGVRIDDYRRNPGNAVVDAIGQYEAQGKDGFFIEERVMGKLANKAFRAALKDSVAEVLSDLQYALAQNSIYRGLWNRTAAILKDQIGLKKNQSLRDNQTAYALAYQRLAEMVAAEKLGDKQEITFEEADDVVYAVAKMIAEQASATSRYLGVDIATGRPLLGRGNS